MNAPRFEGSFLGDAARLPAEALLECKICWHVYDPAEGDEARQVPPGTPFSSLPDDWRCPQCDGEREQFMVLGETGEPAEEDAVKALLARKPEELERAFREIFNTRMRDTPFTNKALSVEAVGFRIWEGRLVGILVAPWFMSIVVIGGPEDDWDGLRVGSKQTFAFPSGDYEFLFNARDPVGGFFACSLFPGMGEFPSQLKAVEVARAAIAGLFDPENREDDDRSADIRALREAELASANAVAAAKDEDEASVLTRRTLISGGAARPARTEVDEA